MEPRWPWYRDETVQQAVRQFILALVLLSMALLGYDVQVSRQPTVTTPVTAPSAPVAAATAVAPATVDDLPR